MKNIVKYPWNSGVMIFMASIAAAAAVSYALRTYGVPIVYSAAIFAVVLAVTLGQYYYRTFEEPMTKEYRAITASVYAGFQLLFGLVVAIAAGTFASFGTHALLAVLLGAAVYIAPYLGMLLVKHAEGRGR